MLQWGYHQLICLISRDTFLWMTKQVCDWFWQHYLFSVSHHHHHLYPQILLINSYVGYKVICPGWSNIEQHRARCFHYAEYIPHVAGITAGPEELLLEHKKPAFPLKLPKNGKVLHSLKEWPLEMVWSLGKTFICMTDTIHISFSKVWSVTE